MLANYHTHTVRCGHAAGEDRAFVESAISAGLRVLGFTDHCPWIFPDGFCSRIRMTPGETEGYFNSLTKLRDEYKQDITIYIGFESEYLPELLEAQDALLAGYPVDYQIMGQHYIRREPFGQYCGRCVPDRESLREYVDSCIAGMETGRYKYLAHPDLLGCSDREAFEQEYSRLCAYLKAHDLPVEINMIGVGRHYSCMEFLRLASSYGCKAIIGIDAHTPEMLHAEDRIAECLRRAETAGLELLDYLPGLEPIDR